MSLLGILIALVLQLLGVAQQPNVPLQTKVDVVNTASQVLSFAKSVQEQQQNTQGQPVSKPATTTVPNIPITTTLTTQPTATTTLPTIPVITDTPTVVTPTPTPAPVQTIPPVVDTTPVVTPAPEPVTPSEPAPTCTLKAVGVVFQSDHSVHAIIGWTFTPGAFVQFSAPVERFKNAPASITQPDNTKQDDVYTVSAPNIVSVDNPTDTTYTMDVTNSGGTGECSASVHIPSFDSLTPVSAGSGVPFTWN